MVAFYVRPGTDNYPELKQVNKTDANGTVYIQNITYKDACYLLRINTKEDIVSAITLFTLYFKIMVQSGGGRGRHVSPFFTPVGQTTPNSIIKNVPTVGATII